jgi:hypothetical protein
MKKQLTTKKILEANPEDVFTQREFSKDKKNFKYKINLYYATVRKKAAVFFFDDYDTVAVYGEDGELLWKDWYSKYQAWKRNGEFVELNS